MSAQSENDQELSLEQINNKYQGMWVAIIVTKRDKNGQPVAGKVVATDPDRYRLRNQIYNYNDICIFFAGDPPYPLLL